MRPLSSICFIHKLKPPSIRARLSNALHCHQSDWLDTAQSPRKKQTLFGLASSPWKTPGLRGSAFHRRRLRPCYTTSWTTERWSRRWMVRSQPWPLLGTPLCLAQCRLAQSPAGPPNVRTWGRSVWLERFPGDVARGRTASRAVADLRTRQDLVASYS